MEILQDMEDKCFIPAFLHKENLSKETPKDSVYKLYKKESNMLSMRVNLLKEKDKDLEN
jgi:hypothetical protein